jgi:hypothetical protein
VISIDVIAFFEATGAGVGVGGAFAASVARLLASSSISVARMATKEPVVRDRRA